MDERIIRDISNFIFIEDELSAADAILVPGGSYPELPEMAASLIHKGYSKLVVPSGAFSIKLGYFPGTKSKKDIYNKEYKTECELYTDVLTNNGVDGKMIIQEDQSQYTAQNALFSKKLLDARGINLKLAIICCKSFHARRCLMYYQLAFPETKFLIAPVTNLAGVSVSKDDWYKTRIGIDRVMGELTRIASQFSSEIPKFI